MNRAERLLELLERAHATLARLLRDNGIARELRLAIEEERAWAVGGAPPRGDDATGGEQEGDPSSESPAP